MCNMNSAKRLSDAERRKMRDGVMRKVVPLAVTMIMAVSCRSHKTAISTVDSVASTAEVAVQVKERAKRVEIDAEEWYFYLDSLPTIAIPQSGNRTKNGSEVAVVAVRRNVKMRSATAELDVREDSVQKQAVVSKTSESIERKDSDFTRIPLIAWLLPLIVVVAFIVIRLVRR